MTRKARTTRIKKAAKHVLATFILFAFSSCATFKASEKTEPLSDFSSPSLFSEQDNEDSPQRTASDSLIESGKTDLEQGRYDGAADLFHEAVTLDPTNGAAYYYLALTKLKAGEYGDAESFAEKAKTLLSHSTHASEWQDKLKALREEIETKKPR